MAIRENTPSEGGSEGIRKTIAEAKADRKTAKKAMKRAYKAYLESKRCHRAVKKYNAAGFATEMSAKQQQEAHGQKNRLKAAYHAARAIWHGAKAGVVAAMEGRADRQKTAQLRQHLAAFKEIHG